MLRHARTTGAAAAFAVLAGLFVALSPGVASAEPADGLFTDKIDDYARYDGAKTCSPTDKPGATALKTTILTAYSGTTGSISRPCSSGTSEHSEGRALDWMVRADTQHAIADDFLNWLLADDAYGNKNAMARRYGVMYIIFDHRMWRAYSPEDGWQSYDGSNPHTDHMHISMSWDGALQKTTWFNGTALGIRLDQARVAATWGKSDRLDVFRRDNRGELQQRTFDVTWGDWQDVGGSMSSGPAAVWAGRSLWVFARDDDGFLVQRRWRAKTGWDPWEETDVPISAAPAAASKGKRVDVAVTTPEYNTSVRTWMPRVGWSDWANRGGGASAPPALAWRAGQDRLDLFVRGGTGGLYQQSLVDGIWIGGWVNLGGFMSSGPAATSYYAGRVEVYARSDKSTVIQRYDTGAGWGGWVEFGGRHVSGPSVTPRDPTRVDLFTRDRSGSLNQNTYVAGSGWSGWGLR